MEVKKIWEKMQDKKWLMIIRIILIVCSLAAIAYFVKTRSDMKKQAAELNKNLDMLNPARKLIDQKDLIVNVQPLRDELGKFKDDGKVSIYFEYLKTGTNISVNQNAEFYPASLLKVPVAMAVAKKIEKGDWKWSNELVLLAADRDNAFGTLHKEPSNSTYTIEELVKRSLTDSDNTAHNILVRNLEESDLVGIYEHMGLHGYLNSDGKIGAKKYSSIFRSLYNATYLSEEDSQKLLTYLSQSEFGEYIQSGLPKGIGFSHKIGIAENKNIYLDSGIVYAEKRPYILTIMVEAESEQSARTTMKDISEKAFNYINNYQATE